MDKIFISKIHEMVLENPMRARNIAQAVGKPYSTLLREVNPYDSGAKLGAETLLSIMKVTGDVSPLEYMARELGCRIEPRLSAKVHSAS